MIVVVGDDDDGVLGFHLTLVLVVPIRDVWAVKGGRAELRCDIAPPDPRDQVYLVLWYRELAGKPLYSYDLR